MPVSRYGVVNITTFAYAVDTLGDNQSRGKLAKIYPYSFVKDVFVQLLINRGLFHNAPSVVEIGNLYLAT